MKQKENQLATTEANLTERKLSIDRIEQALMQREQRLKERENTQAQMETTIANLTASLGAASRKLAEVQKAARGNDYKTAAVRAAALAAVGAFAGDLAARSAKGNELTFTAIGAGTGAAGGIVWWIRDNRKIDKEAKDGITGAQ
jgi:septal ring factor EnvC (AmiA/AmiB activator)